MLPLELNFISEKNILSTIINRIQWEVFKIFKETLNFCLLTCVLLQHYQAV